MRLYVVRHGDAVSDRVDPARPLSDKGRAAVERSAVFLNRSGIRVGRILHSGKKRAEQTAELFARTLGGVDQLGAMEGLRPNDPIAPILNAIDEWTDDTMLVGHMPFVGNLVSQLVAGSEEVSTVLFLPATVACLVRTDDDTWTIRWTLSPELLTQGSDR